MAHLRDGFASIVSIDGKPLEYKSLFQRVVDLVPGHHTVTVDPGRTYGKSGKNVTSSYQAPLSFEAQSGHHYDMLYDMSRMHRDGSHLEGRYRALIRDNETKRFVADSGF